MDKLNPTRTITSQEVQTKIRVLKVPERNPLRDVPIETLIKVAQVTLEHGYSFGTRIGPGYGDVDILSSGSPTVTLRYTSFDLEGLFTLINPDQVEIDPDLLAFIKRGITCSNRSRDNAYGLNNNKFIDFLNLINGIQSNSTTKQEQI